MKKLAVILTGLLFAIPAYAGELTKETGYSYQITEKGDIRVNKITKILDDGKEISRANDYSGWLDPEVASTVGESAGTTALMDKLKLKKKDLVEPTVTGVGLEETVVWDNSVTESGHVQVRRITRIYDGGELVSKTYHRYVISPGDDYSNADTLSKAVAEAGQTQAVIDAYSASKAQ